MGVPRVARVPRVPPVARVPRRLPFAPAPWIGHSGTMHAPADPSPRAPLGTPPTAAQDALPRSPRARAPRGPDAAPTLGTFLRRYAGLFAVGAAALVLTNGVTFAIPKIIGWFIDGLGDVPGGGAAPGPPRGAALPLVVHAGERARSAVMEAARHAPGRAAALVIGLATVAGLLRVASRMAVFQAGRRVEYDLRQALFARLCALAPSYFRRTSTGDLLSRASNDLTAVRVVFGPGVLNIANTFIVYVTGVTLLWRISPRLTLLSLVPYPLVVYGARRLTRRIFDYSTQVQARLAELSTQAQETLSGIQVVQVYGREAARAAAYQEAGAAYVTANLALARTRGLLGPLALTLTGAATLILLSIGGRQVMAGALSLGQFVEFQGYLAMLAWPTMALGWMLSLWQRGQASLERINQVLRAPITLADPPGCGDDGAGAAPGPGAAPGEVEVRALTVSRVGLPDAPAALHEVSLRVPAGTHLGVVGPTGCGKSTLAEALARMLEVPAGAVLLDGVDVTALPLAAVRARIGYAQQEPFLFSATLRENLRAGLPAGLPDDAVAARLQAVLALVQLADDIARLPAGLDTRVGERGVQLSGGQRQRLALARALLRDPALLVLDDALSAVDPATEAAILRGLQRALVGRSAVIISHRVAAVQHCAQIIVLHEGRVVERGSHDSLLAAGGTYARLSRLQQVAQQLDTLEAA